MCLLLKFLIATVYCLESLHSADIVWCTNCTDSPPSEMSTWTNIMFSSFHSSHWLVLTVGKFLQKEAFTNFTPLLSLCEVVLCSTLSSESRCLGLDANLTLRAPSTAPPSVPIHTVCHFLTGSVSMATAEFHAGLLFSCNWTRQDDIKLALTPCHHCAHS